MTAHFTTACYVQADDKDKRNEVCDELERIGYEMSELTRKHLEKIPEFFQVSTSCRSRQIHVTSELGSVHKVVGRVDCGTNTELFLALASMRSDTDKGQWFTDGKVWILCDENDFIEQISNFYARQKFDVQAIEKATTAEIIEHFNKK